MVISRRVGHLWVSAFVKRLNSEFDAPCGTRTGVRARVLLFLGDVVARATKCHAMMHRAACKYG